MTNLSADYFICNKIISRRKYAKLQSTHLDGHASCYLKWILNRNRVIAVKQFGVGALWVGLWCVHPAHSIAISETGLLAAAFKPISTHLWRVCPTTLSPLHVKGGVTPWHLHYFRKSFCNWLYLHGTMIHDSYCCLLSSISTHCQVSMIFLLYCN
jgi:hypothetical protein